METSGRLPGMSNQGNYYLQLHRDEKFSLFFDADTPPLLFCGV